MSVSGILPVNKPEGLRSTDCVQKIRSILGRSLKVGHGGTLDSTASGLLVILVGQATRLSNFVMELPKVYEAEVALGRGTTTDDASGETTERAPWGHVTDSALDSALCAFFGWRMQRPPAVSAVHVGGERAHAIARSGRSVLPEAKPVCFLDIARLTPLDENGRVRFRVSCRRGTYVRSFARDLGGLLGTAAHLSGLIRLSSGPFSADKAKPAAELFEMTREELAAEMIPTPALRRIFPSYEADRGAYEKLSHGQKVSLLGLKRRLPHLAQPLRGRVIVASEKIFSVCAEARRGGSWELAPEVNILIEGDGE